MTLLLLLTGTGTTSAPVYTGLVAFGVDTRRRIEALDVQMREGVTASLPTDVKRKIETLRVDRSG